MNEEDKYLYGVYYYGRNLGWIAYDSKAEAERELDSCEDKHAPARLARRRVGPVEVSSERRNGGSFD